MKTVMQIEFETKKMSSFYPEEYLGEVEKCPKDERVNTTNAVEEALHYNFAQFICDLARDDSQLNDVVAERLMEDEAGAEGVERLSEYGNLQIRVRTIEGIKRGKVKVVQKKLEQ